MLVAGGIRALFLDQGLWADEVQSLGLAQQPTSELLTRTGLLDVHPPLYYLLLKVWVALGSAADVWARALSLVLGSATVGVFVLWARPRLTGPALLFGTALLVVSTWHVHYSLEVRSYALLTLLVLALLWRVERWMDASPGRWQLVICGFLTVAVGLTHYYGAFCLLGINAMVFLNRQVCRERLTRWALCQAASLAIMAAWWPFLFVQLFDLPPGFTSHLAGGVGVLEILSAFGPASASPLLWLGVAAGALVLGLAARGARAPQSPRSSLDAGHHTSFRGPVIALVLLGAVTPLLSLMAVHPSPLQAGHPVLDLHLSVAFDRVAGRLPWAYGTLVVGWLLLWGGSQIPDRFRRLGQLPGALWVILTVSLCAGAAHVARPSASLRNLLVLLPMVTLLAAIGLQTLGRRAVSIGLFLAIALASLSLPGATDGFQPRPDLRGVADRIPNMGGPVPPHVFVISAFDQGTLARYLERTPSQGIMSPKEAGNPRQGPVMVVLTREALAESGTFRAAFTKHFQPERALVSEAQFRGATLLVYRQTP